MNINTISKRAALLRADLAMLPTAESLALSARTADADGPFGELASDLHGLRGHLNALYAHQDESYTLWACGLKGPAFDLVTDYRLDCADSKTLLTQEFEIRSRGFLRYLSPIIAPLMRKGAEQQLQTSFARLKELTESAGTAERYPPGRRAFPRRTAISGLR